MMRKADQIDKLAKRNIFSMCGLHKSQRRGSATQILQKMLRYTGWVNRGGQQEL